MTTKQQLDEFYRFATDRVGRTGTDLTIDELFHDWRSHHPTNEELNASTAAVNAAYADFLAGDRGEPARESLRQSCRELGLESNP